MRASAHINNSHMAMPSRANQRRLKPRKQPAQQRSVATVATILEAAARILEAEGFDGYTTNAVAERAGVSIGSLYQYFPNKDAITRALIERETAPLMVDVAAVEASPDGAAGLERLIAAAVRHQLRRPVLARILDLEEDRLLSGADKYPTSNRLTAVLKTCVRGAGFVSSPDAHIAGDLVAIIKGMVDAAGQRGERNAKALVLRVERAVFGYLRTPGR